MEAFSLLTKGKSSFFAPKIWTILAHGGRRAVISLVFPDKRKVAK